MLKKFELKWTGHRQTVYRSATEELAGLAPACLPKNLDVLLCERTLHKIKRFDAVKVKTFLAIAPPLFAEKFVLQ
jgi:hypothetical protein